MASSSPLHVQAEEYKRRGMSEGEQYVMLVRFIRWAGRGNVAACH